MDVDSPAQDAPVFEGTWLDLQEDTMMQDVEIDEIDIDDIEMENLDTRSPADWNGAESESVR